MTAPVHHVPDAPHHPAVEEYLETIFHLEESGVPAMRARLVERLHVSAPAVSEQVRRLEREGFVTLANDRTIGFTDDGRDYATAIVRRHRLAERLLVDVLGLPWHQVHEEAGRLEHAISPLLEARLVDVLGDPVTCPHGNPIPGARRHYDPGPLRALTALAPGETGTVARIEEHLQADHLTLMAMERAGVLPDCVVTVRTVTAQGVTLDAGRGTVRLGPEAAAAVRLYA
ncbi:MAG TPA: metal-dependent transcriptional regulator [Solirubrobacteraceae bacterium]|nr:metal-dependent transcriptional regulator [Solirubrobacteraceae bacterium]